MADRKDDWQEVPGAVSLEDAATASALAREASSPFGLKRPAGELLERFGGDANRATAALTLAGIAADPPLAEVQPSQWVQLRQAAAPEAAQSASPPASARRRAGRFAPASAQAEPTPADAAPPRRRRSFRPADIAARHAPTGPVTRERRFGAAALGLGALLVVMLAAVLLRGAIGDDGGATELVPTRPATVQLAPPTTPRPAATGVTTLPNETDAVERAAPPPQPRP
jgi:hypothetical protein